MSLGVDLVRVVLLWSCLRKNEQTGASRSKKSLGRVKKTVVPIRCFFVTLEDCILTTDDRFTFIPISVSEKSTPRSCESGLL